MNYNNKRSVRKKLTRNFFMEALAREAKEEEKRQRQKTIHPYQVGV